MDNGIAIPKLVEELIQRLPREPGNIWTPDGDEILCDTEVRSDAIADFIDALYGGSVTTTGYYDNEADDVRFDYYYVKIDGC